MHYPLADRIIMDGIPDGRWQFSIPVSPHFSGEHRIAETTAPYPPEQEMAAFDHVFDEAVRTGRRVHITPVSLAHAVIRIRELYTRLGYFRERLGAFVPDLERCPVTIGVSPHHILTSYLRPPARIATARTPHDIRVLVSGINAGLVSTIHLPEGSDPEPLISEILSLEHISPLRLANALVSSLVRIGYEMGEGTCIVSRTKTPPEGERLSS